MAYHFDPKTLAINYDAIRQSAEISARTRVASNAETASHFSRRGCTPPEPWTFETAYAYDHARMLDAARGHVEGRRWIRERDAALAAMPARERRIHELREAAHLAPMIDDTPSAIAEQDAAERELAALLAEPV